MLTMTDKINTVSVNTDGKLQKLDEQYSKLAEMKSTNIVRTEVRYIEKETTADGIRETVGYSSGKHIWRGSYDGQCDCMQRTSI